MRVNSSLFAKQTDLAFTKIAFFLLNWICIASSISAAAVTQGPLPSGIFVGKKDVILNDKTNQIDIAWFVRTNGEDLAEKELESGKLRGFDYEVIKEGVYNFWESGSPVLHTLRTLETKEDAISAKWKDQGREYNIRLKKETPISERFRNISLDIPGRPPSAFGNVNKALAKKYFRQIGVSDRKFCRFPDGKWIEDSGRPGIPTGSHHSGAELRVDLGNEVYLDLLWVDLTAFGGMTPTKNLKGFWMGKFEVTQPQWKQVVGAFRQSQIEEGDFLPISNVNWKDAIEFCNRMGKKFGGTWRLPSMDEAEYVCRAGTTTKYFFGDDPDLLGRYAWYYGNCVRSPQPVGQKEPNKWGFYDMLGNVQEWCLQWKVERNPNVFNTIKFGGSSSELAEQCTSSTFQANDSFGNSTTSGFRVVYEE